MRLLYSSWLCVGIISYGEGTSIAYAFRIYNSTAELRKLPRTSTSSFGQSSRFTGVLECKAVVSARTSISTNLVLRQVLIHMQTSDRNAKKLLLCIGCFVWVCERHYCELAELQLMFVATTKSPLGCWYKKHEQCASVWTLYGGYRALFQRTENVCAIDREEGQPTTFII